MDTCNSQQCQRMIRKYFAMLVCKSNVKLFIYHMVVTRKTDFEITKTIFFAQSCSLFLHNFNCNVFQDLL